MPTNESVEHHTISEKGDVPNNKVLPLILYKNVADFGDKEPESVFEEAFARHNWGNGWRSGHPDGIFAFHHYHSDAHEVVGIARGTATIQFGGPTGPIVKVKAGDAAVIPAMTTNAKHIRIVMLKRAESTALVIKKETPSTLESLILHFLRQTPSWE